MVCSRSQSRTLRTATLASSNGAGPTTERREASNGAAAEVAAAGGVRGARAGQFVSLLITSTGFSSSELARRGTLRRRCLCSSRTPAMAHCVTCLPRVLGGSTGPAKILDFVIALNRKGCPFIFIAVPSIVPRFYLTSSLCFVRLRNWHFGSSGFNRQCKFVSFLCVFICS